LVLDAVMTFERWNYLASFIISASGAIYCAYISKDPTSTAAGRLIVRALDSWFFSTRWSRPPATRLKVMAVVGALLAVLALVLLIFDPEPRYRR
jgi:hypothetical protein